MFEKVRAHLRFVSRSGHNQAESMCAWPVAITVRAEALAGAESTGSSSRRAAGALACRSSGSAASSAAVSAVRMSKRRGDCSGRVCISPFSATTSCSSSQMLRLRQARRSRVRS